MRRRLTAREVEIGINHRTVNSKMHQQALKQRKEDQEVYKKHEAERHQSYLKECARDARRRKEWERDAPRRRAEEERRLVEQERERAELRVLEEKIEDERVAVFDQHVELIGYASCLSALDIKRCLKGLVGLSLPHIEYLRDQTKQGLPQKDGFNIFQAIFNNDNLSTQDRCELLTTLLYEAGYKDYLYSTVREKLIDKLSSDVVFDKLLVRFKKDIGYGTSEYEKLTVLRAFVRINHDNFESILKLFDELSGKRRNVNNIMVLIKEWMSAISNSNDVGRAYQALKNEYQDLRQFDHEIREMAELRILEIEKNHKAEHKKECDNLGVSFHEDTQCSKTDREKVESFLKKSDHGFFKLCFSSKMPSTLGIYNMIQQDKPQVEEELSDKKKALEEKINTKVSKVVGHEFYAVIHHPLPSERDDEEDENFMPAGPGRRSY